MYTEKKTIFIDGSSGTAGLRIYDRLAQRADITLLTLPPELGHDIEAQREMLNRADIAFLCLPDAAAITAADLVENPDTVVLDTSTAHRTAPGWVYGFPELSPEREAAIRTAKRRARLPRQRLRRAHLSARRGGHPAAGRAADLLLAHGLQRRRQEDDRRI